MTWNWRTTLGAVLLAAAIISGWSAWQQRARPVAAAVDDSKADYVLRDFELIALDKESGKESMTLRAPEMHRNRADQTSKITTPVFLLPDIPLTLETLLIILPYSAAVETTSFEDRADGSARIEQTIYVERESQRPIVLGKGGQTVKWIGQKAREELTELLDRPVHLFLTVKVDPKWQDSRALYAQFGLDYDV